MKKDRIRLNKIKKIVHNCLHLGTLIAQSSDTMSNAMDNAIRQQHHDAVRQRYELLFLQSKDAGITEEKYGNNELIVSLTSYGQRIHSVYLTIESIMQQTMKPNKIILWLSRDEFTPETIPASLKTQQGRGLELRFTEDIKSYKKLIPALIEFPDGIIVTVDDDCIYPINLIDILYQQHRQHPNDVICTHAHIIDFDGNGELKPYTEWKDPSTCINEASHRFLAVGCGGILYPPHCFHTDVLDKKNFMVLAPTADDLWFKIMALRHNTTTRKVPIYEDFFDWITLNNHKYDISLFRTNITQNDIQIKRLLEKYNVTREEIIK